MMPKLPKKQQKARQLKRLADLALLTGSYLDAAEHAARASAELKVLNDALWYVGALSTWCAAALTCSKNGDTISLRCILFDAPCVTGFRKTGDLLCASHLTDAKQFSILDAYLQHCVCLFFCALLSLTAVNATIRLRPVHVKP